MGFHGKTEKNFYFLINVDLPLRLWLRRFFYFSSVIWPLHCPEIDRQGAQNAPEKEIQKSSVILRTHCPEIVRKARRHPESEVQDADDI